MTPCRLVNVGFSNYDRANLLVKASRSGPNSSVLRQRHTPKRRRFRRFGGVTNPKDEDVAVLRNVGNSLPAEMS